MSTDPRFANFNASAALAHFFDGLRATGTNLQGTNAQLTQLLVSGLEGLSPDSAAATEDANTLQMDLEVLVESLCGDDGDADYPADDEDGTDGEEGEDEVGGDDDR